MFGRLYHIPLGASHERTTVRVVFSDVGVRQPVTYYSSEHNATAADLHFLSSVFRELSLARSRQPPRFERTLPRLSMTDPNYSASEYRGDNSLSTIPLVFRKQHVPGARAFH